MALTYGFYNSVEGDRTYDAIQFGRIFDGLITDGIYANYEQGMVVMASENAGEVIIQPGRAWFNHTWSYNDANFVMAAPAPEVLLHRIDALVLDIDTSLAARENKFMWVTGEPSSKPVRPTLIHTVTHNQYALCYVQRYPETTTIKAADITNVIGRETPIVAGVLNPIDVSTYIDQWDDEFHTWEDSTRSSFESWMITQQEIYTNWYDAIKNQMEGDLNDFESWFETIQGIIDEEAATHLQSEIDALAAMLPAGSHITVTTNEQSLYLRNVTVSDVAGHSATAKFDNTGVAVIESFPYIGNLTLTATDGTPAGTATEILPAPYFGRYNVSLAFWAATINLNGDSSVGGVVVKVKDHTGTQLSTVTLNASGKGVYSAAFPDTYTFEWTIGGDTMEVSLNVTEETTYSVEIYAGFNWRTWCTLGGVSTYGKTSLSDVFANEEETRKLMTVHASADYLIDRVSHNVNDIDEFTVNDTAMKWIGLRDYVCDGLTAISGVWAKFLASNYWERILKDHVPTMTSNTAPYGTVTVNSTMSDWSSYGAFGDDSKAWASNTTSASYCTYRFTNPICVKKFIIRTSLKGGSGGDSRCKGFNIQASNDNTNWTTLYTDTHPNNDSVITYSISNNDNYYLYYKINITSTYGTNTNPGLKTLQYYGRSLNVSVPSMTSNTAPYGEVFASSQDGNYYKYYAYDKVLGSGSSNTWFAKVNTNSYTGYKFTRPVVIKSFYLIPYYTSAYGGRVKNYKIQGSNNNTTWVDIYTGSAENKSYDSTPIQEFINNSTAYKYYRLYVIDCYTSSNAYPIAVRELNFYGVDYTEREFAEGSTVKYIYDHGVELMPLGNPIVYKNATAEKRDSYLYYRAQGASASAAFIPIDDIDFSSYSLYRIVIGDYSGIFGSTSSNGLPNGIKASRSFSSTDNTLIAELRYVFGSNPTTPGLDISSVNDTAYLVFGSYFTSSTSSSIWFENSVKELWLE